MIPLWNVIIIDELSRSIVWFVLFFPLLSIVLVMLTSST